MDAIFLDLVLTAAVEQALFGAFFFY